jgi:acyl-CoA thioester hydrolase
MSDLIKRRVHYFEVDRMNHLFYGYYPLLYEEGRTAFLRKAGISNYMLEKNGILIPAISLHIHYKKPAHYDDLLSIQTSLKQLNPTRMLFSHIIWNQKGDKINEGESEFCFIDKTTRKPLRCPEIISKAIK